MSTVLELAAVSKTFTMHLQGGIRLPVVAGVAFAVQAGECAVLAGPSGAGKSSILKMIFGTYRCDAGSIVDPAWPATRSTSPLRSRDRFSRCAAAALGYVSQFLRAVPRVAAIDVVAEPLGDCRRCADGGPAEGGRTAVAAQHSGAALAVAAGDVLGRGAAARQHRQRASCPDLPLLLLDEPTASLDAGNRAVVVDLVAEKKRQRHGRCRDRARRRRAYGDCRHRR